MERPTEDSLSREHAPIYFPVSVLKLVILSICTFGLYEIYWFGENWRCEKARTNEVLRPAWRGVFAFFFCNSLLNRIKHYATQAQVPASYSSALLTATYILLTLCYRLPDPWWLAGMCSFLPLIPVQRVINHINAKETPTADSNARLSGANWALIDIETDKKRPTYPQTVQCWKCKHFIDIAPEIKGKKVQCPHCRQKQAMPI